MWLFIGHQKQQEYLRREISTGQVKPAYLLAGPEKVGKFTLVRRFAKMLQCPSGGCDACAVCTQITQGTHPDTVLLPDTGESLKVEEVREINRRTSLTCDSPYFVIGIEHIERMTEEGANALLKTLEEPPPRVVFLLTTANKHRLLPTLLSRVFTVELGGIREEDLLHYLRATFATVDEKKLETVLHLSWNKPGLAIEMLSDETLFQSRLSLYMKMEQLLLRATGTERLAFVEELHTQYKNDNVQLRQVVRRMLEIWLHLLRTRFLATMQQPASDAERLALIQLMERFQTAALQIESNVNKKLVLDYLMLSLTF